MFCIVLLDSPKVATDSRILEWIHVPIQGSVDGIVHTIVPNSRKTHNLRVET